MLPYKTLIKIDKEADAILYLQICNAFIKNISCGNIQPGYKLPGSRALAGMLEVNRRTVISAYEELEAQGWVEIRPNQGCFVSSHLPVLKPQGLDNQADEHHLNQSAFAIGDRFNFLEYYEPPQLKGDSIIIDAGYPDIRLAPLSQLSRHLAGISRSKRQARLFNYSNQFNGDPRLQQAIIQYLEDTRSIHVGPENVLLTRGSLMAFSLIFQTLLSPGDAVIVGDPGFHVANNIIQIAGGKLVKVKVDEQGIDVDQIAEVCKKQSIRAVFIMPHHHNPTTVSLSAKRRMQLLMLAREHRFAIIEDDYDYDYHYANSPILPMASSDRAGSVIYVGSLSKTVAPGLRMGFVLAPANVISDLSRLSRFVDCHGNRALERAIAYLFEEGEIRRHLKKSLQVYHRRRDHFCTLLQDKLGDIIDFDIPEGGLAAWVRFKPEVDILDVRLRALEKGLQIPKSVFYDASGKNLNSIRMGFASLDEVGMGRALDLLVEVAG